MSVISNFDIEELATVLNLPLVGVYSKNRLPKEKKQGYYVVNLQNDVDENGDQLEGTHWVCFGIFKKNAFYFDSYGFICPVEVKKFLKGFNTYYNTQQIQSLNATCCGWYCVGACHYINKNDGSMIDKLVDYIKMFEENDLKKNDKILYKYLTKQIKN